MLQAQDFEFERISNELGLSQNLVSALCQDKQGFIWVGTKDGLNRFDGHQFRVFQNDPYDSTSLLANHVKCLLEDSQERLWVGTVNGLCLMDRNQMSFRRIWPEDKTNGQSNDKSLVIATLMEDQEGNIWVGTDQEELIKITLSADLSKINYRVLQPTENVDYPYSTGIKNIAQEQNGRIWVLAKDRIFWVEETQSGAYQIQACTWQQLDTQWSNYSSTELSYRLPSGKVQEDQRIYSIFRDDEGNMWAVTAGGFSRWLPEQQKFTHYPLDVNLSDYPILPLEGALGHHSFLDQKGRIWHIGIRTLIVYDTATHQIVTRFHTKDQSAPAYFRSGFRSMIKDSNGNVWLGTNGKGLYKYTPHRKKFSGRKDAQCYQTGSIYSVYQTSDRNIWIGTSDKRLIRINPETGDQELVVLDQQKWPRDYAHEFDHIFTMKEGPDGTFWLGGRRGLYQLYVDEQGNWDRAHYQIYAIGWDYPIVMDIHFDEQGALWLLTPFEFGRFDIASGEFEGENYLEDYKGEKGYTSPCIHQQNDSIFWLGTNHGFYKYNAHHQVFSFYTNETNNRNSLSHPIVKCIQADPQQADQVLWIGTGGGGLCRFDTKTEQFLNFDKQDGLPDNVIYGVLDDKAGNLWLSTNQGISRFNPLSWEVKNYSVESGLQENEFNTGAYHKGMENWLFFGGINGLNTFDPSAIQENEFQPSVVITDFKIANKPANFGRDNSPLQKDIAQTEVVHLTWNNNFFSLEFAALDYTEPDQNEFAYRMANFNEEWQYIGTQRMATFTNLNPGEYTFQVKGTNHDGVWNEHVTAIRIIIQPPWWRSWIAYLTYLIAGISAIVALYRFQFHRQMVQVEAENLKKLDILKTRFYTNITHEFRTPLTVIHGMSDQIAGHDKARSLIRRNSQRLLKLINQMLDLSKLESSELLLQLVKADIIPFLRYLTESFHSLAAVKEIELVFQTSIQEYIMDFDEEKIQQIIYNLFSNALKFTSAGGTVFFRVKEKFEAGESRLELQIQDTGIGIPANALPYIFERFYQAGLGSYSNQSEGSGIGLALTKELVLLMEGIISVESELGKGTTFTVLLPAISHSPTSIKTSVNFDSRVPAFRSLADRKPAKQEFLPDKKEIDQPLVLIVEDNTDFTIYIERILKGQYQTHRASDGQQGIDMAVTLVPDLIITDVMMPEKDGFELCEVLKSDERTCHIPIVMLTAKASQEDRLTGLKTGADAYLLKPFNKEELLVRLEKLIALRQVLQEQYAKAIPSFLGKLSSPTDKPNDTASLDEQFLQKIIQIIEEKIGDAELNIAYLSESVHLSSTQLFRKMKALTGEPPMSFIRKIRLHKAKMLLQTTNLTIAEIAYDHGFTDPNYFSRAFSKEFGEAPSLLRKN